MTGNFFLVSLSAFCLSLLLTPVVRKLSPSLGLMDFPGGRKIHSYPTPSSGGLVLFISFIIPLWFCLNHFNYYFSAPFRMFSGIASGGLFITLLGVLDDRFDLKPHYKLLGQIAAACILGIMGRTKFKQLMSWALGLAPSFGRIGGAFAILFGGFLIHAVLGCSN